MHKCIEYIETVFKRFRYLLISFAFFFQNSVHFLKAKPTVPKKVGVESAVGKVLTPLSFGKREPFFKKNSLFPGKKPNFKHRKYPFHPRERFQYRVFHESAVHRVLIGTAVMETGELVWVNDSWAIGFRLVAKSSEWYRWALQISNTVDGYIDFSTGKSLFVTLNKRENTYREKRVVQFDYRSQMIVEKEMTNLNNPRYRQFRLSSIAHEGHALAYFLRAQNLSRKRKIYCNVYQNGKLFQGIAKVQGNYKLRIGGREFIAVKVLLTTFVDGALAPRESLVIYYSADHRKVPLLINASVIAGQFTVELLPKSSTSW